MVSVFEMFAPQACCASALRLLLTLTVLIGYCNHGICMAVSSPGVTYADPAQDALIHFTQTKPNNAENNNIAPSLDSTFPPVSFPTQKNPHKRLNIASTVSPLSHQRSSSAQILTIVYGGQTIADPSVIARATDYAHSQETFTISNEFFGGDPFRGVRKWVFVAYKTGGGEERGDGGEIRLLVGWEGEGRILGEYHLSSVAGGGGGGGLDVGGGDSGDGGGVRLYAIAYGGKLINDAAVVERLLEYAESGDIFTVGNELFGCDPDFGSLKYGIIVYECGGGDALKYFVMWEGERRTLGRYEC